jgi:hypothetical protein
MVEQPKREMLARLTLGLAKSSYCPPYLCGPHEAT